MREEQKLRGRLLEERARELGIDLEQIDRNAEKQAAELLHSPNLKVWRYVHGRTRKAHLYAETSDHFKHALCRQDIDEGVPAQTVNSLRGDECHKCAAEARLIFQRKPI